MKSHILCKITESVQSYNIRSPFRVHRKKILSVKKKYNSTATDATDGFVEEFNCSTLIKIWWNFDKNLGGILIKFWWNFDTNFGENCPFSLLRFVTNLNFTLKCFPKLLLTKNLQNKNNQEKKQIIEKLLKRLYNTFALA